MAQEDILKLARSMHTFGHQDTMVGVDGERAEVEDFVMRRTECDPVRLRVRSVSLMPPNVGGLQGDGHVANTEVESTQSAAVLISDQHSSSELGISATAEG